MPLPDFVIIGAMKCGTSTLAAQLGAQDGVFMSTPKEPNFFSDDDVFAKGLDWYENLFAESAAGDLKGEASTHYTKLPTHPRAAERLYADLPRAKLIYITRDPLERLISHYLHEWSMGAISTDIETALDQYPELIDYGCYERQIAPWRTLFGEDRILRLALEDMQAKPQAVLDRVAAFLDRPGAFVWQEERARENVSSERIRKFPLYDLLVESAPASALRRSLIPQSFRDVVKSRLRRRDRPELTTEVRARIAERLAGWAESAESIKLPAEEIRRNHAKIGTATCKKKSQKGNL